MKKLLSILTITTLTASIPAPLVANTTLTRVKRDVGSTAKDVTSGFDLKIKFNKPIQKLTKINSKDYNFSQVDNKDYTVIWRNNINNNWRINKFNNNNILISIVNDNYPNLTKFRNRLQISNSETDRILWVNDDGTYFKDVYRIDSEFETNTPEIDSVGNITKWTIYKNNKFQQGISFSLAENDKTATWSNAGMRLTVDGETNININNPNVTEVYWDGAKQNMLEHKVNINVKPETSEKTHKLVIKYDINGTKYTSEDIDVVMAAKIDPPTSPVQQNLSDVIKFADENNLGNIFDNNDDTIFSVITQKNARTVDFSQIEITNKTDTQATLSAIEGSKNYQGSVIVKYNISSATTVDLKIDVTSSASGVQIDKDYLAQLDSSKMTNKVDPFYYANGKSTIKIKQPSTGNVIIGKVYGCDERWNKTSQSSTFDPVSGLEINKGQYGSVDGRYLIELQHKDLPTHTKTIYLQISEKQKVEHYWNTAHGKQFEQWAEDNGYKNIRGYSASQLNNLFELSKTWKQSLKHLDLKLDNFVVDNIKNVTQDEIETYKTKLLASIKAQVKNYAPDVVKNTDYKILVDNLVAGDWTVSKDVKVQSVDGSTKLLSFTIKIIPVQQKEQPTPTPDNKKGGDSKLWIIGVVGGVLLGVGILALLFKKFVFNKYIYPKIIARRHDKLVEQVRKEETEKQEQNEQGGEK
ncbi:adhesin [Spiroplasma endosymbiont of Glossina fuscipes fuscipes]|uniref:adhesin n=1 Tax=Spiroplasma endosymbiont of Glossina fuscipes fuscipes TaxID=2004463 RepID=UPI003C737191